jgi:hypothetical protein
VATEDYATITSKVIAALLAAKAAIFLFRRCASPPGRS